MRPPLIAVLVAIIVMLLATVVGALRLLALQGFIVQPPLSSLFRYHGELMVFGFLAPLIVTERYIGALNFRLHRSLHLTPYIVALGAVLVLVGSASAASFLEVTGRLLLAVGMLLFISLLYAVGRQSAQPLPSRFMMLAAALLFLAALFTIRTSPLRNVPLTLMLLSFPLFTILGERIELARFLSPRLYRRANWGLGLAVLASALLLIQGGDLLWLGWAVLVAAVALPLLQSDAVLMRGGETALHRYLGRHLAFAYSWLFLGLLLLIVLALQGRSHPFFDVFSHSIAVGFVGTMILAHAPVVAPTLLRRPFAESRLSLVPLVLLTAGNLMRVTGYLLGETGWSGEVAVGFSGVYIIAALAAFAVMMLRGLLRPA